MNIVRRPYSFPRKNAELKNLPQSLSTFLHLSRGRIEDLTSLLSELSGTPLTMEITTKWLSLEPQGAGDPQDSPSKKCWMVSWRTQKMTQGNLFP